MADYPERLRDGRISDAVLRTAVKEALNLVSFILIWWVLVDRALHAGDSRTGWRPSTRATMG